MNLTTHYTRAQANVEPPVLSALLCGWLIRQLVRLFGMETFSIAAVCSLPEPVLIILHEYMKEVPL